MALEMAEKALNSGGHLSGHHHRARQRSTPRSAACTSRDLIILAGRPGMGKTALATNIAFAAAQRFLRDMEDGIEPEQVGRRAGRLLQPRNVGRPARHPHPRRAVGDQLRERCAWARSASRNSASSPAPPASSQSLPLYIDDTPGLTIAALRTRARRLKRQNGIGMVVVDYLQLLQGTGKNSNDNRVQEISEISRGLKTLAKELDVPVLALSQLSRAVEQREDKRPQLSDLRESGSIEQDADIVLFVYREEYYVASREPKRPVEGDDAKIFEAYEQWQRDMERVYGLAELIVAKQRHGATGKVRLKFDSRITKFSDAADDSYLPEMRDSRLSRSGEGDEGAGIGPAPSWRQRPRSGATRERGRLRLMAARPAPPALPSTAASSRTPRHTIGPSSSASAPSGSRRGRPAAATGCCGAAAR